ncbi:MAG: substrate-binding domain-containing protein [Eubacteriales bacterium]
MKKTIAILLCLTLIITFSACSSKKAGAQLIEGTTKDTTEVANSSNAKNVALVMKTLTNPFFIEMEKGARLAEKEFKINLIVKTAAQETSIDQQIQIVEDLIVAKVDAIVIAPGGSTELIPVLKKAQDAGIKVVNIDNQLDPVLSAKLGLKDVPFISVDNMQGAYLSAKYISDMIKTPSRVAIIEGISTAKNAQDRAAGAVKAFKENSNITSVVKDTANWKIDESYEVTKKLFLKYPDIKAIFCANDMMALGTIQYLQEKNKKDVLVAGFDALAEAKDAIKQKTMVVTIDQQASVQGYEGVKSALALLNGEKVELNQIIDVKVVTFGTL